MERDPALCREFVARTKDVFSNYPEIKHSWSVDADEDHCILDIPKQDKAGIDITVEVYPAEITIIAEGAHHHLSFDDAKEAVERTLGLVRDLLSTLMRVRECRAAGSPYRWYMEIFSDGQWVIEEETGLFFWNYFGHRDEIIYQNKILPSRTL